MKNFVKNVLVTLCVCAVMALAHTVVRADVSDDLLDEVQAHIDYFTDVGNAGAAFRWGTVLDRLEGESGISDSSLATWLAQAEAAGWRRGKQTLPKVIEALKAPVEPPAQSTPPADPPVAEVQTVDPPAGVQAQQQTPEWSASTLIKELRRFAVPGPNASIVKRLNNLIDLVQAGKYVNPDRLKSLRDTPVSALESQSYLVTLQNAAFAFADNQIATYHAPPWLRSPDYQGPAFFLKQDTLPDGVTCDDDAHACWFTDSGDDLWTDIKGWGPWDDLPDQMKTTLKTYDPTYRNIVPRSADLDTEAPGFFREHQLRGPLNEIIWQTCNADCGDVHTRHTLGSARYEGNVTGFIHPNVAESGTNPYGLDNPKIWFQLDLDASEMNAGISYEFFNPGDDLNGTPRRATLDRWENIDLSSPRFNNDGLMGQFYGDGAAIYGLVQRPKIIGQFRADKQ